MKRIPLLAATLLLGIGVAIAQRGATTPPSDVGIGNSTLSTNSDVSNDPSFSPDQNQAITNDRGSTTGDKYPNPAFVGSSGDQTAPAAQSQGAVGDTGSTSATAGRRLPHGSANTGNSQNQRSAAPSANRKSKSKSRARNARDKQATGQQRGTAVVPSEQGPSTTSAPGPSTGVPGANIPQGGNGNYSGTSTKSHGPGR